MAVDEQQMKDMDDAAALARDEFKANFNQWSAKDTVAWWSRWYLKAGHKRLGRVLVALGKEKA